MQADNRTPPQIVRLNDQCKTDRSVPSSPRSSLLNHIKHSRAFTLIELLITISIILVLLALIFPGYKSMMARAQGTRCASNLRQIFLASENYSMDNNGISVPGSYLGGETFWFRLLKPYLGGKDIWDTTLDDRFRCPACKKGSNNYWAWGYAMNAKPGFEGAATSSRDKLYNWGPESSFWARQFPSASITNKSRRLFIADSTKEWHVEVNSSQPKLDQEPDYDRHGKGKCNVLFYDGHIQMLASAEILQALYEPGKK